MKSFTRCWTSSRELSCDMELMEAISSSLLGFEASTQHGMEALWPWLNWGGVAYSYLRGYRMVKRCGLHDGCC